MILQTRKLNDRNFIFHKQITLDAIAFAQHEMPNKQLCTHFCLGITNVLKKNLF
jgi:hypothetical protein